MSGATGSVIRSQLLETTSAEAAPGATTGSRAARPAPSAAPLTPPSTARRLGCAVGGAWRGQQRQGGGTRGRAREATTTEEASQAATPHIGPRSSGRHTGPVVMGCASGTPRACGYAPSVSRALTNCEPALTRKLSSTRDRSVVRGAQGVTEAACASASVKTRGCVRQGVPTTGRGARRGLLRCAQHACATTMFDAMAPSIVSARGAEWRAAATLAGANTEAPLACRARSLCCSAVWGVATRPRA